MEATFYFMLATLASLCVGVGIHIRSKLHTLYDFPPAAGRGLPSPVRGQDIEGLSIYDIDDLPLYCPSWLLLG